VRRDRRALNLGADEVRRKVLDCDTSGGQVQIREVLAEYSTPNADAVDSAWLALDKGSGEYIET
jgi:hypothetical protein